MSADTPSSTSFHGFSIIRDDGIESGDEVPCPCVSFAHEATS